MEAENKKPERSAVEKAALGSASNASPPKGSLKIVETEQRHFGVHPAIIWNLVHNQAVGIGKALQELAQNAVDAGATKCEITMTPTRITIDDNGKGFASRKEIIDFFETFGTPHEEGDATYGRFRMGRGQIMAYGSQRWRTGDFLLQVDLKGQAKSKNKGLLYDLVTLDEPHKGCKIDITLYDKQKPSEVDAIERDVRNHLKYLQIPLIFNGEQINKLPKDCEWDFEDDVAYYSLKETGQLSLYSLGVFVCHYPASTYGCGGTVVSKVPVDVIFARNGVASSCKVFKKITAKLRATTVEKSVRKPKLTESEWEALANALRVGTKSLAELMKVNLLRTSSGAVFSFADLGSRIGRGNGRIAVAKAKDMVADRILQRGIALVLDQETISRFGYASLKDFKAGIVKRATAEAAKIRDWQVRNPLQTVAHALQEAAILEKEDFSKYVKADYEEVPLRDLSPAEKFAFKAFSRGCNQIGYEISRIVWFGAELGQKCQEREVPHRMRLLASYPASVCEMMINMAGGKDAHPGARTLRVGASATAEAWTDGESTIWINRMQLKKLAKGTPGLSQIAALLLHEYLHQSPNLGALNEHSPEFYELHHDLSVNTPVIGRAVEQMTQTALRLAREERRKPTGALKRLDDQRAELADDVFVMAPEPESFAREENPSPALAP